MVYTGHKMAANPQLEKQLQSLMATGKATQDPLDPSALKKRYDDCVDIHRDELQRWKSIEEVFSTRLRQTTGMMGRESLRFYNNSKYHTSSLSTIINKTSSQLMSLAIPIRERGVSLVAEGNTLENNDPDGKKAQGLSDFSHEVIEQFYSPKSGIHNELVAACKDLMVYGNAAMSDNMTADGFRATAMDFARLIIETDSVDNAISAIFRERAPSTTGSMEYEIWLRNPKAKPGVMDLRNKKSYPWLYIRADFSFKALQTVPLITMPIHYLRLYSIPGYPYGKGYGEELLSEGQNLHSFRAGFNYAALLSLNPPIFLNTLGVKHKEDIASGKLRPGQIIESNMQAIKEMPLVVPITQYNINEIAAFAPYEQRLEFAISKATMEEYYSLPKSTNMTDLQVAERVDEITSVLAGPISGLNSKYVISVVENIQAYLIADAPVTFFNRGLADIDIKIIVHTRYDEQQNMGPASRIAQGMQMMQGIAATNPEIMDNVDQDAAARELLRLNGWDPKLLRPKDVVQNIREVRQAAQEKAQMMQNLTQALQQGGMQ
jgi:hypothetical protein